MKIEKTKRVDIEYLSAKTIGELCTKLKEAYNELDIDGEVWDVSFETRTEYDSTYAIMEVSYRREETEGEKKERLFHEQKNRDWKRIQYEKLKAEFGE